MNYKQMAPLHSGLLLNFLNIHRIYTWEHQIKCPMYEVSKCLFVWPYSCSPYIA